MKRHLNALWVFIVFTTAVSAQSIDLTFHVVGGTSFPVGDFGRSLGSNAGLTRRAGFNIGNDVGLAGVGFGGGLEVVSPAWLKNLSWILGARVFVNGSDAAAAQSRFQSLLEGSTRLEYEVGEWINIPIMTGLRYGVDLSDGYVLYGALQAGVNLTRAAPRKATVAGVVVEDTEYQFARDFGFEAGLGILVHKRYNLGVRFLDLGSPRYEGTRMLSEKQFPEIFSRENAILGDQWSISMVIVTLGVEFSL